MILQGPEIFIPDGVVVIADGRIARRDAVALVLATVLRGVEEPQP
jgi:hypothetical protein